MSSPGSPSLEIKRSVCSQYAVVAAVLLILSVVPWFLPLGSDMAVLLAVATCALAVLSFWRIGWLGGARALHKALWTQEGEWHMFDSRGDSWVATLHPGSQVMGELLWLRFTGARGPRELLLLGQALTPEARRRLVARLRLQADTRLGAEKGKGDLP